MTDSASTSPVHPLAEPPFVSGQPQLPSGEGTAPPQPESEVEMASTHTNSRRLIEDWFPVNEISVEAVREGGALAGHPPVNQLHVWWARRPLIASRAAVAASILPADTDRAGFIRNIGTSPEVVTTRRRMDAIKATGQWSDVSFSNQRSFLHNPIPLTESFMDGPTVPGHHGRRRIHTLRGIPARVQDRRQRTQSSSRPDPSRNLRVATEVRLGTPRSIPKMPNAAFWNG